MNEPADTKKKKKWRYLFQFIVSASAFYGLRFLFGGDWIANPYLGYVLTVIAGTCLYLMFDGPVSWYVDSRNLSSFRWFRFGMVLLFLPPFTFAMMILLFLAGYFCDMAGLISLSNFFFHDLFPMIPSLATDTLASGIHFTIQITMLAAFPGMGIMLFKYYEVTED